MENRDSDSSWRKGKFTSQYDELSERKAEKAHLLVKTFGFLSLFSMMQTFDMHHSLGLLCAFSTVKWGQDIIIVHDS